MKLQTAFIILVVGAIITAGCAYYIGYADGQDDQATMDEQVRQELLHQMDKFFFSVCQDVKDSGDKGTYNRICLP